MKQLVLFCLVCIMSGQLCNAQYDDKFYFPSKNWITIEDVEYSDYTFEIEGDTLNAVLFKPRTTPMATIIFYHGSSGNISTYQSITKPLAKANYQVFAIDFRGYGKSTGTPTHLNIAHDAQVIFNEILKKEEFKNLPVIVYGASMGTQIATRIAKDNQDKIEALILDGTISSFTDMALLSAPEEQKPMIAQYVTSPYCAKDDIKGVRDIPKLLIHSRADSTVPFTQGELVYNNAPDPKTLWVYKGNHLDASSKLTDEFIQRINNLIHQ